MCRWDRGLRYHGIIKAVNDNYPGAIFLLILNAVMKFVWASLFVTNLFDQPSKHYFLDQRN